MSIVQAMAMGIGRVVRAPILIAGVYFFNLVAAAPLALAMRDILRDSLGASLKANAMLRGFDLGWHGEFSAASSGLADTFGPGVTGILPVLSNLERLFDGRVLQQNWVILFAGIIYLFAWAFFAGGIIDRYAQPEAPRLRVRFFSHCAEYFPGFTQLLLLALVYYWAVFRYVAGPLQRWVESATREVTVERTVMMYTLGVYALAGLLLMLGSVVLDYARISMVVEKRRGALRALLGGAAFVWRNPVRTIGLNASLLVMTLLVIAAYAEIAPGAGQATGTMILLAFVVGQAYIVARMIVKLWFYASQTVLMQAQTTESLAAAEQVAPSSPPATTTP